MEPGALGIFLPLGRMPFAPEDRESIPKVNVARPMQPRLRPRHPKPGVVRGIIDSKPPHGPVDDGMLFPALEVFRFPPASIHGHNDGADPHLIALQNLQSLCRHNRNVNLVTRRPRRQEGMTNLLPVIGR